MLRPSLREGMGANPRVDGVAFRVWAPHADAVFVISSFNDWAEDAAPIARETAAPGTPDLLRPSPASLADGAVRERGGHDRASGAGNGVRAYR